MVAPGLRRRRWWMIAAVVLIGGALAFAASAAWFSRWLQTAGRQRLELEARQRLGLTVSIGQVRSSLWQGLLLSDVLVTKPTEPDPLLRASVLRVRIAPLSLLRRQVQFRIGGELTVPFDGHLSAAGSYALDTAALAVELSSSEVPLVQIAPPYRRRLPSEVRGGAFRLTGTLRRSGGQQTLAGHLSARALIWQCDPWRMTTDAEVDGEFPTAASVDAWQPTLSIALARGTLDGAPIAGQLERITGTATLVDRTLVIHRLDAQALGGPWTAEGTLGLAADWLIEAKLQGPVPLATLARQLPALQPWQPAGTADVIAVCRGPLARWPQVELLATATVRDGAALLPTDTPQTLRELTGRVRYDHLARLVTVETAHGRLAGLDLNARGTVAIADPPDMRLDVEARGDVRDALALAGSRIPIREADGPAAAAVTVSGTPARLRWEGHVDVDGARLALREPLLALEQLRGRVEFANDRLTTRQLTLRAFQRELTLSGGLTGLGATPRVAATLQTAGAALAVQALVGTSEIDIERSELTVGRSRLRLHGTLARPPADPSDLTVRGTVDTADLAAIPALRQTPLQQWAIEGQAEFQLRVTDQLRAWPRVRAMGWLAADQFSVRGLRGQALRCEFEQTRQRLQIRLLQAALADGRISGEIAFEPDAVPERTTLALDVMRADLGQVAQAFPAWRDKQITGTLSGRVELAGPLSQPAQLDGRGWIQAAGDHLGELPLLDRLFQGALGWVAERLGLSVFRKAQLTEVAGQWRLAKGRVATEDLRLSGLLAGADPVTLYARGSVGLDKTLDFLIDAEFPEHLAGESPILSGITRVGKLVGLVTRHRLTGTVDQPVYRPEFTVQELLNQTLPFSLHQLLAPPDHRE